MEVDTQKDIQFYSHLINTLGPDIGDKAAEEIFAADLSWIDWEICQSEKPKAFFYKIMEVENETRLVHQRDLIDREDILLKINPRIRQGLEFLQMSNVRSRLIQAENGAITAWISPKKLLVEDPEYPLDQINIAKKIDKETVWVKQIQGDFVNLEPDQTLKDVMLTVMDGQGISNLKFLISNEYQIPNDINKGKEYVAALKQGLSADSLRDKRAEILQ